MRFLLTLILVALATPAAAQNTPGPNGPFAVVDDNGKVIGGVFGEVTGAPEILAVSIGTPQGSGFVRLTNDGVSGGDGVIFDRFDPSEVLFSESDDCTGQAAARRNISTPAPLPVLDGGPSFMVVDANANLYAVSGSETSVTYESVIDTSGVCHQVIATENLYPLTTVGNLGFTPPFHVVTVSSLSAAVPIEIGWLLGGLLLGLGVKRAVGR